MADIAITTVEPPRRFPLHWIPGVLFTPRQTMAKIAALNHGAWFFPLLILTLIAILAVIVTGPVKIQEAQMTGPELPENWQYLSPEQQAQITQAYEARLKPVFIYVFPGFLAVGKVWVVWMIVSGLLHLTLTMLGGRGSTTTTINMVAWASLPFAVRDVVRIVAMLNTHQLLANPGLSGFTPLGDSRFYLFLGGLLTLIDFYLIWYVALLVIGVRAATKVSFGKAFGGVAVTVLVALLLGALVKFGGSFLSNLNVVRPFFF